MFVAMVVSTLFGVSLLVGAPLVARMVRGPGNDPVGLTRILQLVGVILLIGALLVRPSNPETTAVPPPPDLIETQGR